MRTLFACMSLFILISCNSEYNSSFPSSRHKLKVVDELLIRTKKKLYTNLELVPLGDGAQMLDTVKVLALSFQYQKPVTTEESRRLLLLAIEQFVEEINADSNIRPYLAVYPFPPERVEIRIFLKNNNSPRDSTENYRVISCVGGRLEYDMRVSTQLKTVFSESYNEALQKRKPDIFNTDQ